MSTGSLKQCLMALVHQMRMLTSDGRAGDQSVPDLWGLLVERLPPQGSPGPDACGVPEPVYLWERGPLWGNGRGLYTCMGLNIPKLPCCFALLCFLAFQWAFPDAPGAVWVPHRWRRRSEGLWNQMSPKIYNLGLWLPLA